MIRGTTFECKIELPCQCSDISCLKVVFWQSNNNGPSPERPLPIVKVLKNFSVLDDQRVITVVLSAGETLRFTDRRKGYMQYKGITVGGVTFGIKPRMFTVYPQSDETLGDDILPTPDDDGYIILDGELGG